MRQNRPLEPCYTAHLFRPLLQELLDLLRGLGADDWQRQTLAPQWKVRDVMAHLLDGDLAKIAVYRDGHLLAPDTPITSERGLTAFINRLNAGGVDYARRLSPRLLIDLLDVTGHWVADLVEALPPHARSVFPVSWAGEAESQNWMDTGREYTERWHHQMQIRDAVGQPLLLAPVWMSPLLDISVRALPHAYRLLDRAEGTAVALVVAGETDGAWTLERNAEGWQAYPGASEKPQTTVRMTTDSAWRLFYNAPVSASHLTIEGDMTLAQPLLKARSVIV